MPSIKEIYNSIGEVELNADSINLNVDGLEALASTQQADVAAIKTDIANGVTINQPVAVTDNNGSLTVDGTVTADSNRGNLTAASTQSITTGGTHQQVFATNASRKFLLVQNLSDTDMYLGIGFNPSNTTPDGILLSKSGGGIVFESSYIPTQEIRIVCATTGKRFEALEA
jgi:hypothetical protein